MLRSSAVAAATVIVASSAVAPSAHAEQKPPTPDLVTLLSGYEALWAPSSTPMHGEVKGADALAHNDELVSWVNGHATAAQRTRALQDAMYRTSTGEHYDQSLTIADGLGATLGDLYLEGRREGKLPLTSALLDSSDGSAGAFVSTSSVKNHFNFPRPFMRADPSDRSVCIKDDANASSLAANRMGRAWADSKGNLAITRVATQTDTSHRYSDKDVVLDPNYDGICSSPSFPSGHTATAYQAGTTLATLVPEAAPSVLARTSEAGNNRIVLGVHYPFDVIGGRMSGELAIATLWHDASFRSSVLEPARKELRDYLTAGCTKKLGVKTLAECVTKQQPYTDDPYGGATMPGGTSQKVTDRASALGVFTERLAYGIGIKFTANPVGAASASSNSASTSGAASTSSAASNGLGVVGMDAKDVPAQAADLLRTTYPTLTDEQRREVLAQTAMAEGSPLAVGTGAAWQRMNLAAAMSATVHLEGDAARVTSTGGVANVDGHSAVASESASASSAAGESSSAGSMATGSSSATASDGSSSGLSTAGWIGIGVAALAAAGAAAGLFLRSRRR